jgi:hypothetical protein
MFCMLYFRGAITDFFFYADPNVWGTEYSNGRVVVAAPGTALVDHNVTAAPPDNTVGAATSQQRQFEQHFELNDPVAAFVSVTGLVFALVFASNYTDAQCRLNEIRNSLAVEVLRIVICDNVGGSC